MTEVYQNSVWNLAPNLLSTPSMFTSKTGLEQVFVKMSTKDVKTCILEFSKTHSGIYILLESYILVILTISSWSLESGGYSSDSVMKYLNHPRVWNPMATHLTVLGATYILLLESGIWTLLIRQWQFIWQC